MILHPVCSRLVFAACLFALGCGGGTSQGRKVVYPVSGKVTMSGGPLVGASVAFAPMEGQPVAVGRTNNQGEFTLTTYEGSDGAAEGQYSVVITKSIAVAATTTDDAHSSDPYAEVGGGSHSAQAKSETGGGVPEQYTSSQTTPLNATVKPDGDNNFPFEL